MVVNWSVKSYAMKHTSIIIITVFACLISSCLTEEEKRARQEQKQAQELAKKEKEEHRLKEFARQEALEDSLENVRLEKERKEKAIYDKYYNNRLQNGATPYAYLYGINRKCNEWGCSSIKVTTSSASDVMVLIKKNDIVVKHAYIRAGFSYNFEMPNGTYQPFFYYGKGWNPNKIMNESEKGLIKGGFISDEHFSKDFPQALNNNILEYELILQKSGNFSEKPSSPEEVF